MKMEENLEYEDEFKNNTFDGQFIHVLSERCKTCIFRPGNLMHLPPGRVSEMCDEAQENNGAIICHSTLDKEQQAVCKGFFDRHPTIPLQVAVRLDRIKYD